MTRVGMRLAQAPADLRAADVGQPRVEENHIGSRANNQLGHLTSQTGLRHDFEVPLGLEQDLQPLAHHLVIVDDQDPDSVPWAHHL
jgi:hypothetical protein